MQKASTKLIEILEQNDWYVLPNYPFKQSFYEEIDEAYYLNVDEKFIEEIEQYSQWCLDNLDLVEKINI